VYHAVTSPDRSDGAGLARRRDSLEQAGLEGVPEPAPQVFRRHVLCRLSVAAERTPLISAPDQRGGIPRMDAFAFSH
jgi:hypothetical protein